MKASAARAVRATTAARGAVQLRRGGTAGRLSAQQPGGARRHFRNVDKAQPRRIATELVTTRGDTLRPPFAQVALSGPETLDTKRGRVILSGPDLSGLRRSEPEVDATLRGLPTVLLNDGRPKSAAELEAVRTEILNYFDKTFTLFEKLHEMFTTASSFYVKHERLRHPPIFYLGHTASFYVNKLHLGKHISERIDPLLEMQMAVGVDEMSWDDWDSKSYVWASGEEARADEARAAAFLQKVLDFRRDVRTMVENLIRTTPMEWPVKKESFWWVIMMGIEHERIHLETSSVIHRQAALDLVKSVGTFPLCDRGSFHKSAESSAARSLPPNRLIPVERGTTRLGRSWEGTKTYGWDNEFGKKTLVEVPAFAASEFLVSNKEFLDFVNDGGYAKQHYWTEEGWNWVSAMSPSKPLFWRREGDEYHLRTLSEEIPMPWDWPAEVCHNEAAAYCKWLSEKTGKKLRLPMEDEYLRLRDAVPTDLQDSEHGPAWGEHAPGNINLSYWASPCPVDTFPSAIGVYDVLGNVWQHCETHIDVLDGFQTHPLYDDFTTPCIGEHHSRIMGGSWMSSGATGGTRDSRYGFRRHFYQHAGFRYIESDREVVNTASPYESDRGLCDAFRFHFDAASTQAFHTALAQHVASAAEELGRPISDCRIMELGCGPGRTVLEMARLGAAVSHGADRTSKAFQLTAQRLLIPGGRLRWTNYLEGEFVAKHELTADDVGIEAGEGSWASRTQFYQMPDFAAVDTNKFHDYDVVVCAEPGALGSTSSPLGTLGNVHGLLKPGGLLVLGTQYEWAAPNMAGSASGQEVVAQALERWFEPALQPQDLHFVRPETARKSQCGVQHLTFWRRRQVPLEGAAASSSSPAARERPASLTAAEKEGQPMYDDELTVGQYLDFHFGPSSTYPAACAARCSAAAQQLGVPVRRALEVGGGPGRAAFELGRTFHHVDSGDYSRRFVELGQSLANGGELRWRSLVDRTAGTSVERSVSSSELFLKNNVSFSHMDAQNLPKELSGYDLICGFNLIDRLARPQDFLREARSRLNDGGLLVLSSPYSWAEEFTRKDNWLGGFKYGDNDGPTSYEGLKAALNQLGFVEALPAEDISFRIDELGNGRKSQQTQAQMTFWRLSGRSE